MAEQESEQLDRVAGESRSAPVDLPLLLLPDDALLEVMQYLQVADLLACRLVCRRLGALALHPQLWRHQRFPERIYPDEAAPVLRLAPCFGKLVLTVPLARPLTFFTTTNCAVETLWLTMQVMDGQSAIQAGQEASLVIRNQEALGRLRRLYCSSYLGYSVDPAEAAAGEAALLATLASTSQLEELRVFDFREFSPSLAAELRRSPVKASLKVLILENSGGPKTQAFANHILSTHASTLESVELGWPSARDSNLDVSTFSILAGMPKLSKLRCVPFSGMDALAECPLLRDVTIDVSLQSLRSAAARDAAAKFLRRATQQLVKVELVYNAAYDGVDLEMALDMVQALAATGTSRVETLSLVLDSDQSGFFRPSSLWMTQALLQALPSLPALRTLKVELDEHCAHEALHMAPVQQLLASNPALRLVILARPWWLEKCDWCKVGCHPEISCDGHDYQEITIPRYENVQLSLP
ncbi:F-box/LRR-repeat protein 7 [Frankliniella fusca]|uniref:F-box/LRR-repeat protein 7 n=1 Tax=Frankliniella fusca TaxID=407009 RepID=A0AAE1H293_9NEOP|nr:F-box/LRR-repeat protein 7 [Frankliniella fusca]